MVISEDPQHGGNLPELRFSLEFPEQHGILVLVRGIPDDTAVGSRGQPPDIAHGQASQAPVLPLGAEVGALPFFPIQLRRQSAHTQFREVQSRPLLLPTRGCDVPGGAGTRPPGAAPTPEASPRLGFQGSLGAPGRGAGDDVHHAQKGRVAVQGGSRSADDLDAFHAFQRNPEILADHVDDEGVGRIQSVAIQQDQDPGVQVPGDLQAAHCQAVVGPVPDGPEAEYAVQGFGEGAIAQTAQVLAGKDGGIHRRLLEPLEALAGR